jgi:2-cysteine adaptor domain
MNKKECDEWDRARLAVSPINPFTKRHLKKDGPTFKKIDLLCNNNKGKNTVVDLDKVCTKWLKDKNLKPSPKPKQLPKQKQPKTPVGSPTHVVSFPGNEDLLSSRKTAFKTIGSYLRKTVNDQTIKAGDACMSNTKTLLKYFTNVKAVGKGSFGTVYVGNVKMAGATHAIAIKEGQITRAEAIKARNLEIPQEFLFNQLMNNILNKGFSPSFNYSYCILFCDHCEAFSGKRRPVKPKTTTCSVTMVEKAHSDLKGLLNDQSGQLSAIFQILAAIHCIHILYGIQHFDIKVENILMRQIRRNKNEYWVYNVDGVDYYVPNTGFVAILNDFGVSASKSPTFSKDDYGIRNAEVVKVGGGLKFRSFTTENYPYFIDGGVKSIPSPKLRGAPNLTINRFWKGFNSHPSIKVDLLNFKKFPGFFMYEDIQDVIRMFVGGYQATQNGTHSVMKGLDPQVKNALAPYNKTLGKLDVWPENMVELFLANKLIHKIFTQFKYNVKPRGAIILETYTLPA